ncbi:hypothetical protein PK34_21045 [Stutzerimonas stutzeri]|jgi:hypothetical protein|uniref:hypothetical protein n=1 Tax=Stutzerimonas stutzeri subgroup TaxID=578833 RepID=UPI000627AF57|nr:hypothetical protein [Stutzerimonas kunmingensis]KKJ93487.1 hypothetical protein PK34_21045 [Stutzerimonas stutzeri]|tara:strand:- start:342 stop:575 length:234 start_codon:yes stop_codon:yes gene_type:complete
MFSSYLYEAALIYGLVFTSVGFVLGMFYNNRKVFQLEDKVQRLKRTVRHPQRKVEPPAAESKSVQRARSSAGLSSVR